MLQFPVPLWMSYGKSFYACALTPKAPVDSRGRETIGSPASRSAGPQQAREKNLHMTPQSASDHDLLQVGHAGIYI